MNSIVFTNHKGGVAKTTMSLHVAAGLAIMGKRVLLLDTDAQAHATQQLGFPKMDGLYRLIVKMHEWRDLLVAPTPDYWADTDTPTGRLVLLPSNEETSVIPLLSSNVMALRERLDEVASAFDVVVVDTSPTQSLLHAMIDMVADYVIYPTKCEELSLQGLADSTRAVTGTDKNRKALGMPPIKLIGVLPTMFRETRAHMHGLTLIEDHFGADKVLPALAERTIWADQSYARQTLFRYAPGHDVTAEVWKLVQRVAKYVAA